MIAASAPAAPVQFTSVRASSAAGGDSALILTIDGVESSARGWSLGPEHSLISAGEGRDLGPDSLKRQEILFIPSAPVEAGRLEFSLFFLCGAADKALAQFSLSATTDPQPSFASDWQRLKIERFTATNTSLEQVSENQLRAVGKPPAAPGAVRDPVYTVTAVWQGGAATAFRLEAIPVGRPGENTLRMSWAEWGEFVLTEFRVEGLSDSNTNLALGARVTSSHLLPAELSAGALTDGMPSTYAHPWQPDAGPAFFFEIDLGRVADIDHIGLRGRGDNQHLDRLSRLHLVLYDAKPDSGVRPAWEAGIRADGSHPANGAVDLVNAADGRGRCRGRYLRLSSDSPVALSPQLAEVEVYGTRTPKPSAARADGRDLEVGAPPLRIPANTRRLTLRLSMSGGSSREAPFLWRLKGYHEDWQNERSLQFDFPCPPPGAYTFEARAVHSDGRFDASVLSLPVIIARPFVQTPAFYGGVVAACAALGALLMRRRNQRKIARLETETALARERSRIARDMHDEVGARLSQLSVLQDTFARDHDLPAEARRELHQLSLTARQAVQAVNEVVWTINPRNDTLESLAEFLIHHADNYLSPLGIRCRLEAPECWPALAIRSQTRHELVLAFKEALQNVVKHARATQVDLSLQIRDGRLVVSVADDGVGPPPSPPPAAGNGIGNMKSRLEAVGGSCEVSARSPRGVEVVFRMPLDPPPP